jgi:hypothetical protein
MSKGKEVAATQDLFPQSLPESQAASNRGNEQVGGDLARPRINLVQSLSACMKKSSPHYNKDAEAGDLWNSATGELYKSIFVCNLFYFKDYAIFKDFKKGGGYYGNFKSESEAEASMVDQELLPRGDYDIVESAHHICAMIDLETKNISPIEIIMKKTQMKPSDQWNLAIKNAGGDRFASVWEVAGVIDSSGNNEYANFAISPVGFAPDELHALCVEAYESIVGKLQSRAPAAAADAVDGEVTEPADDDFEDDIPF